LWFNFDWLPLWFFFLFTFSLIFNFDALSRSFLQILFPFLIYLQITFHCIHIDLWNHWLYHIPRLLTLHQLSLIHHLLLLLIIELILLVLKSPSLNLLCWKLPLIIQLLLLIKVWLPLLILIDLLLHQRLALVLIILFRHFLHLVIQCRGFITLETHDYWEIVR